MTNYIKMFLQWQNNDKEHPLFISGILDLIKRQRSKLTMIMKLV